MDNESKQGHKRAKRTVAVGILSILLLLTIGASGFLYVQYRRALTDNPDHELEQIIGAIRPAVLLPAEKPSLSTILDVSKLTNKTLKARAQNGDKILVYTKAKRLIIYRPASGKIVDMLAIQDKVTAGKATTTPIE